MPSMEGLTILNNDSNLPWHSFLGYAGMSGKTAFYGWKQHAKQAKEVCQVPTSALVLLSMTLFHLGSNDICIFWSGTHRLVRRKF